MPNNYPFKPRGIIKWHAFAAVISGAEQMEAATDIELLSFELLDDKIQDINDSINKALTNKIEVICLYLEDNIYQTKQGYITFYSAIEQYITFDNLDIKLSLIKDISLL